MIGAAAFDSGFASSFVSAFATSLFGVGTGVASAFFAFAEFGCFAELLGAAAAEAEITITRERIVLASFIEHGRLLKAGPGEIEIGFLPQDSLFLDTLKETENLTYLRRVARELLGGRVEVRLVTIESGDGIREERKPRETDLKQKLRHEAMEHPAVQWALELFQAHVVDLKVL